MPEEVGRDISTELLHVVESMTTVCILYSVKQAVMKTYLGSTLYGGIPCQMFLFYRRRNSKDLWM